MAYESNPRALYGVWIDQALSSDDPNELRAVLKEAKKFFPRPQPLYGVVIDDAIQRGASNEELQQLLTEAEQTLKTLPASVDKLRARVTGQGNG
ncbi:MAG TPA: hypothetical protein VGF48_25045 [Thermoanaerobaculia bacterium]|jgi:hypothetical protein